MYTPQNFERLLGTPGFSDTLLKNHFTLYEGYVKNTNGALELLKKHAAAGESYQYGEVKRRFGWEWNGMRLHELYFGNMTAQAAGMDEGALKEAIAGQFGSWDAWLADFKASGTMRGIGWTVLYHDAENKKLFNTWIEEHHIGHLATCTPLLVLDVFEHAYVTDYGLKRADYIDAFVRAIDWKIVGERFFK